MDAEQTDMPDIENIWDISDKTDYSWTDAPEATSKERLLLPWVQFIDNSTVLEVRSSLKNNDFKPVQLLWTTFTDICCLHFDMEEWREISNIKTEHLIRQTLKSDEPEKAIYIGYGIKIELLFITDEETRIRVSRGNNAALLSEQAINLFFWAVEALNQKLNYTNDYRNNSIYKDFINKVATNLYNEGLSDDESILPGVKFFCQNLRLLSTSIGHSYNVKYYSFLTKIVHIFAQKFIKHKALINNRPYL